MRTARFLALTVAVATLVSCSSGQGERAEPRTLPPAEPEVASLLPTGTYTFTGGLTLKDGLVTKAEGFVDFGTGTDGADCESDYTLTYVKAGTTPSVTQVQGVRTAGRPSFYRDLTDAANPGDWKDLANPDAPRVILLFVPAIITSDFSNGPTEEGGTGNLCSIGFMSRFMSLENGALVFDTQRTEAVVAATRARWTDGFVEALGLRGRKRDRFVKEIGAMTVPSFEGLIRDTVVTIEPDASDGFTLTQIREGKPNVELTFTPAPDRTIDPITAPIYFATLAEEVRERGLDAILEEIGV